MMRCSPMVKGGVAILLTICAALLWWKEYPDSHSPQTVDELMDREHIAGGVLAVRGADGHVHARAIGRRVAYPSGPLDVGTRFPIASLSKPVTAAAVRSLIRRRQLMLDEPVFGLLADMPHADDPRYTLITIRHLLQHTSGLSQVSGDPMFDRNGRLAGCDHALEETLKRPLDDVPGTRIRYSNAGYCLLGRVIEHVAEMKYEDAVHQILGQAAGGLTMGPPGRGVGWDGGGEVRDEQWRRADAAGGWFADASGLVSLMTDDARDPAITVPPTNATFGDWYYGLGWRVWPHGTNYRLTHFGSLPGMFAVALSGRDGCGAVLLLNGRPSEDEAFAALVYPLLEGEMKQY